MKVMFPRTGGAGELGHCAHLGEPEAGRRAFSVWPYARHPPQQGTRPRLFTSAWTRSPGAARSYRCPGAVDPRITTPVTGPDAAIERRRTGPGCDWPSGRGHHALAESAPAPETWHGSRASSTAGPASPSATKPPPTSFTAC